MKLKELKIAKGVKITKTAFETHKGGISFGIPKDCDLIILMGNKGKGYIPYACLLPHQVYVQDIKEAFEKYFFEVIYVIPIKSKDAFPIVFNGDYGKQRWENKK